MFGLWIAETTDASCRAMHDAGPLQGTRFVSANRSYRKFPGFVRRGEEPCSFICQTCRIVIAYHVGVGEGISEAWAMSSADRHRALWAEWHARFGLFDERDPVPLAVGVREQLLAAFPEVDSKRVRHGIAGWCQRMGYLAALTVEGAMRKNLDGSEAGPVSERDRRWAGERLKEWRRKIRERAARRAEEEKRAAAKAVGRSIKVLTPPVSDSSQEHSTRTGRKILKLKSRKGNQPSPGSS